MREIDFDIYKHCGKCKRLLSEHDDNHFGSDCPNEEVEFEIS